MPIPVKATPEILISSEKCQDLEKNHLNSLVPQAETQFQSGEPLLVLYNDGQLVVPLARTESSL